MRRIPLAKPYFGEEEVLEVRKTLKGGWVAQGPRVKEFEREMATYCKSKYGVAVNSCTSGLILSLLAHGIGKGDRVIVPDFTFMSTGNAVLHIGATPVVVDICLDTFCIDVEKMEELDSVWAVIPVHTFGHPAKLGRINKLAEEFRFHVVEDAASALGSQIGETMIGSHGNLCCFSLQGRKVVTTGEGGMIVLDDPVLLKSLRGLRSQVSPGIVGFSLRMSDIQAAVGLVQVRRIEEFIERRIYLAGFYSDLIEDLRVDVEAPRARGVRHTYQAYVVLTEKRDKVIEKLSSRGIESTIGTYSLTSYSRAFKGECPNGEYAYRHSLALPMYHELKEDEVEYVVKSLKECLK